MNNVLHCANNNLILGRADYQKEQIIVPYIRECISNGRNIVVLDSNGVLLNKSGKYLSDAQYSILLIDIDNPLESSLWNPLLVPYQAYLKDDKDGCVNELYNIAATIMADDIKTRGKDPFWDNAAMDYFVGLSLILFTEADNENQINIENVYRMAKRGSERFANSTYIKEYIAQLNSNPYKIDNLLQTIVAAPSETRGGIETVFYQKLSTVTRYVSFFNTSSKDSIDINKLFDERTAIFIRYSQDRTVDLKYIKVFLSQLSHIILKKIKENRNVLSFNYIFSDFLSLGYIEEIERTLASNSKNDNFYLIDIDSLSNAERIYGDNFSDYIISVCKGILVMPSNEIRILNKVNELYELLACDKIKGTSPYRLQTDTALAIVQPNEPEVIQIDILDSEDEYEMPKVDHEPYQIVELDINEIVKERKKQHLLKSMNESSNDDMKMPIPMRVSPLVRLGGDIVESNQLKPEQYNKSESSNNTDELMIKIEQKIEQIELNESLNKIVNNKN